MKKQISLFLLLLGFNFVSFGQGDGISFVEAPWKEVLDMAKEENKLVFVDAYTTWCGPCKKMTRDVFVQPAAGEFFNKNFINVKLDAEKGEGVEFANTHNVIVYPTLLFLSSDGTLVHRSAGYHTMPQLIELGETALDPSQSLSAMTKRYDDGDRAPNFLYNYAHMKWEVMDGSHAPIASEYLKTQSDWGTDENRAFIFKYLNDTKSDMFNYFVDHKADFETQFGASKVTQKLEGLLNSVLVSGEEKPDLEEVDALLAKLYPDRAEKLQSNYRMSYFRSQGDRENYAKAAVNYFDKFSDVTADELNETAWTFYEVIKDKDMLKKALGWSKKSVKMDNNYYNNDTLAALYYKLGCKKKAIKAAKKAIEVAKAEGQDYQPTNELLEEIHQL